MVGVGLVAMVSSGVVLPSPMVSVGKPSTAVAGSPRGLHGLFLAGRFAIRGFLVVLVLGVVSSWLWGYVFLWCCR